MKQTIYIIIIGFVLLALGSFSDYELQAFQHGWQPTGLVDMAYRAPHWPWYADWIPHDGWHVVQTIHNTADKFGAAVAALGLLGATTLLDRRAKPLRDVTIMFLGLIAISAIARGLTFSLLLKALN
ncbi:MAG: hypothetical protein HY962_07065 [Ignavibacteriae bacterium]|nr:hypothetical protein [Ignavibacteriota bacterium]